MARAADPRDAAGSPEREARPVSSRVAIAVESEEPDGRRSVVVNQAALATSEAARRRGSAFMGGPVARAWGAGGARRNLRTWLQRRAEPWPRSARARSMSREQG